MLAVLIIIKESGEKMRKIIRIIICVVVAVAVVIMVNPMAKKIENVINIRPSEDYIRHEFKELMDEYEDFFDEYIAFMEKYKNASYNNPMVALGLLQDYLNWIEKYSKVLEDFKNVGDSDLTRAEAFYYAEVTLRIEEKLIKAIK